MIRRPAPRRLARFPVGLPEFGVGGAGGFLDLDIGDRSAIAQGDGRVVASVLEVGGGVVGRRVLADLTGFRSDVMADSLGVLANSVGVGLGATGSRQAQAGNEDEGAYDVGLLGAEFSVLRTGPAR